MAMSIDLFPTIAHWINAELPPNKIDGLDIGPLLLAKKGALNPHDAYFFYYGVNELQAVRSGSWKLVFPHEYRTLGRRHGRSDGIPIKYDQVKLSASELYDLSKDKEEHFNVAAQHPDIVRRLEALAEGCRNDLGDSLTKKTGSGLREPGRVPASSK
jgi:arylsulfatase